MAKVKKTDGCWDWAGAKKTSGYGNVYWNGKYDTAHRVSYLIHHGEIPEGFFVCHRCDNPSCVNPAHLFVGSPRDNIRDMMRKGRGGLVTKPGSQHLNARLTEADVAKIIERRKGGEKIKEIAADFGVTASNISYICSGKSWREFHQSQR